MTAPMTVYALAKSRWDVVEPVRGSVDRPAQFAAFSARIPADFAAPEDIDDADLDMDLATELAEVETETDEAPAEVTQEMTVADLPALVPGSSRGFSENPAACGLAAYRGLGRAARPARRSAPPPQV